MAKGITVGERYYPTKKEAEEACRSVVDRYGPGAAVTGAEDDEFLRGLVALHPEYELKRGVGIAGFRVVRTAFGTVGFVITRVDGSVIDFSWRECLKPTPHRTQVFKAFRHAIAPQIAETRRALLAAGNLTCAVTGAPIPAGELHIDHYDPTFLELAERFVAGNGGFDAIRIKPDPGQGISSLELEDQDLDEAWRVYHERHAKLRPVLDRVNLSDLAKGRPRT